MLEQDHLEEDEGLAFLEKQDALYGKNTDLNKSSTEQPKPVTSLGKALTPMSESTIGGPNDSYWKNIPLQNLPSKGLFYPDGAEITIKSASVAEVRQWSTIDESDMLDVDDKLNYIIEKCCRFKIKGGQSWLSWRDISELDRLALIFLIQEITFPADQNNLFLKFECDASCVGDTKWSDKIKVTSQMVQFIDFPEEIMKYYSEEYRCFEIVSQKLNETFYLYMPTIGAIEKLRARISEARSKNRNLDAAFIQISPYLIQDWHSLNAQTFSDLSTQSYGWHINKFTFIKKFTDMIESSRRTSVSTRCPKCGKEVSNPLFSESGFTIKDFFLISGGLDELI